VNNTWRTIGLIAATLSIASCGLFGDKDEALEPKELVKLQNSLNVKRIWSTKLGGDAEYLLVGLRPATDGNAIFAASFDGRVSSLNPANGKAAWKVDLETELSAGPGVGEGLVVLASKDGHIIALDTKTGAERWRRNVDGETLAQPLVKGENVIVQSIDNRLQALSVFDGKLRWELEQTMPALTMRGASSPLLVGPRVIAGFDNGRLLAVNADTGDIEWDSMLSLPTGRSDLDRLSDVDGAIAVVGQDVYAAGYQGRIASLAAESGQVLWSRDISTNVGVAADWNSVYTTRTGGEIIAMGRNNGTEIWRNDDLLRRDPTLPVPFHTTVVVGDFEGHLHFFSSIDGEPVARLRQGSKAISSPPLAVGNTLYVQSDDGTLSAYAVMQDRTKRALPDVSKTADES
jgi:outer membrane protein assembly factor BamB